MSRMRSILKDSDSQWSLLTKQRKNILLKKKNVWYTLLHIIFNSWLCNTTATTRFVWRNHREKERKKTHFCSNQLTSPMAKQICFILRDMRYSTATQAYIHTLIFTIIAKLNVSLSSVINSRRPSVFDVNNRGEKWFQFFTRNYLLLLLQSEKDYFR